MLKSSAWRNISCLLCLLIPLLLLYQCQCALCVCLYLFRILILFFISMRFVIFGLSKFEVGNPRSFHLSCYVLWVSVCTNRAKWFYVLKTAIENRWYDFELFIEMLLIQRIWTGWFTEMDGWLKRTRETYHCEGENPKKVRVRKKEYVWFVYSFRKLFHSFIHSFPNCECVCELRQEVWLTLITKHLECSKEWKKH